MGRLKMRGFHKTAMLLVLACLALSWPAAAGEGIPMDRTEVTIRSFAEFAARTGMVTKAEQVGGMVYEAGWVSKPGWNWKQPYGVESPLDEPAVHITFDEAEAFCIWQGKRLPTRDEWISFAYTEQRPLPPQPFVTGRTYPYPTGDRPFGANCLDGCGMEDNAPDGKVDYSSVLFRGAGHARAGSTRQGVNGLYETGANVWEWARIHDDPYQATMGGSWWYGAYQMKADTGATKPRDMAAVYIGFRCISD